MSLKDAKAFLDKLKTDVEFRKKVGECKCSESRTEFVKSEFRVRGRSP